jgi:hypothetical protein
MLDEALGQRFYVGVGYGKGEKELQKFIILEGPGTPLEKAASEAGPVPVIMGLEGLPAHIPPA